MSEWTVGDWTLIVIGGVLVGNLILMALMYLWMVRHPGEHLFQGRDEYVRWSELVEGDDWETEKLDNTYYPEQQSMN